MHSKMFYFSGTGNSLAAARSINEKLTEKSELLPLLEYEDSLGIKADRVGLIFPVYCHRVPRIVKQTIQKMEFMSSPYIYAVATHAGKVGQSLFDVQALLKKKGQTLSLGIALDMPGNAVVIEPDIERERLSLLDQRATRIAELVENQEKGVPDGKNSIKEHVRNHIVGYVAWNYVFAPKRFKVSGDCTGCATCEKLCPVNNIQLVNCRPEWKAKCATCLACFHWCPSEAIYMDNTVIHKRRKYHHPDITVDDLISTRQ